MTTARWAARLGLGLGIALGGCFATELDLDATGAFACGDDVGCPSGQTCVNDRCEDEDALPVLEIRNPENGDAEAFMAGGPATLEQTITIAATGGSLTLVDPAEADEHVFGEGHLVVALDGVQIATVTSGDLASAVQLPAAVTNAPGPHRVSVMAMRNDGIAYDHAGGSARALFWLDDGAPRVAITSPWPGTALSLQAQSVDVAVQTLNFQLVPPGTECREGLGHVHVYYGADFPACPATPACDSSYILVVASDMPAVSGSAKAGLPAETAPRSVDLTAMLRHIGHDPYLVPFAPLLDNRCPMLDEPPAAEARIVYDTVTLQRE